MVATAVSLLFQLTSSLIVELLPSEKKPVALYCTSEPLGTESTTGSTSMETSTALVTVIGFASPKPSYVTLTVATPGASSSVKPPFSPVAPTLTMLSSDELQTATSVTSWLVLSV